MDCTDPGCVLPELLRHDLIIDCMAVIGGCCGAEERAHVAEAS
jgi:methionine synthase I (cobalamin-dependent)